MVDDPAHRERRFGDEAFDHARGDPAAPVGLAAVVTEGELFEVGLQVLVADRAGVRAQQLALQQGCGPVAGLNGIANAALGLGLHDR